MQREFAPLKRQRTNGPHSPLTPRPAWTALPQAFADANYSTYGAGITVESFRDSASRCPGCWSEGYYLDWVDGEEPDPATFDEQVAHAGRAWLLARSARRGLRTAGTAGAAAPSVLRPFFLMVGFHGGHKPWPLEPETHVAHGTDSYTLRHSDLRQWRKPIATGAFTSLEQTANELKGKWLAGSGERSVGEFESMRRGYLVNAIRSPHLGSSSRTRPILCVCFLRLASCALLHAARPHHAPHSFAAPYSTVAAQLLAPCLEQACSS